MRTGARVQVFVACDGGVQWIAGTITKVVRPAQGFLRPLRVERYEVRADDGRVLTHCHPYSLQGVASAVLS